jgi:hypothetical protein
MTDRHVAEERMRLAKARYTAAARATLEGRPDAQEQARQALAEVNDARAAVAALDLAEGSPSCPS